MRGAELAQVDRRLGMPAPREHASGPREGHHVFQTREACACGPTGAASVRPVSAHLCAEIPMDVPV